MGYILPVHHYQYEQYHDRDIHKGVDPMKVGPAYRVNPIKKGDFTFEDYFPQRPADEQEILKNKTPSYLVEKIRGQITGTGKKFNATA